MNIQQIKYIVALDRLRNFARAAEACDVSQPTLSAMVQKLEEELEVRIFERTNKTVTTTVAGVSCPPLNPRTCSTRTCGS